MTHLRLVVLLLAVAACASAAPRSTPAPAPADGARPEPDPACRGTVQAPLAAHALEQVTVAVSVDRDGRTRLVRFLEPSLTVAQQQELRRALEQCVWKPATGPDGAPVAGSTVLVVQRR